MRNPKNLSFKFLKPVTYQRYSLVSPNMRKHIISALLVLSLSGISLAQDYHIGIKIAPALSHITAIKNSQVSREGTAVKLLLGAFVDIPFKENYFFSGGLNYASKSSYFRAAATGASAIEEYAHEYVQVPLLLKLYTNEIALDVKLFFNFGLVPEVRLNTLSKSTSRNTPVVTDWADFDLAGNFGGGIERSIGVNTRIFTVLNYNLGFLNQVKSNEKAFGEIGIKSNLISLEFGIKF